MGLFDWLRGKKKAEPSAPPAVPAAVSPAADSFSAEEVEFTPPEVAPNPAYDAALTQAAAARNAFFATLGNVDVDVLAPIINPMFMGGPAWPTRPGWRRVTNGSTTILLSDGLSDPFEDDNLPNTGFAVEIMVQTTDNLGVADNDFRALADSFLFHLVYQVSQNAAAHGGFRALIEQYGILSMEIETAAGLEAFTSDNGRVGVILGVPPANGVTQINLPGGDVRIITAKLLTQKELAHAAKGKEGRMELARLFAAQGSHDQSSLSRASVL